MNTARHVTADHAFARAFVPGQTVRTNWGLAQIAFIAPDGRAFGHTASGLVELTGSVQCADAACGDERSLEGGSAKCFSDSLRQTPYGGLRPTLAHTRREGLDIRLAA